MYKKIIVHPLFFAIYPVLELFSNNVSQVVISDVYRSFAATFLITGIFFLAFRFLAKDWQKAGLLISGSLALFFSYGHVISVIRGFSIGTVLIGRNSVLLPCWGLLFIVWAWWVIHARNLNNITSTFNLVGLFLLLMPLYTVSSYSIRSEMIRRSQKTVTTEALVQQFQGKPPDVFYIILDMHARNDVLQTIYGYDDSWFISALKDRKFYVAGQSASNYSSTLQSISSSLNMEYINDLEKTYGADSTNREPLGLLLQNNKIFQLFKKNGYKIAAFRSDDFYTEFRNLDHYLQPGKDDERQYQNFWSLNSFEGVFVQSTLARVLYDSSVISKDAIQKNTLETPYNLHRLTIQYTAKHLPDLAQENGAFFVFAHIVAPHPPYVFGRNGESIPHNIPFSLSGPGRQDGGAENMQLYVNQLHYIDTLILKTIDEILAKSDTPPIMIIQGDHGPVSYSGDNELEKGNMWEQHAILNAYYFPDGDYRFLYPSITPVNSFRVVLNTYFGGGYDLLPDRNYFLLHARPYDFIDVTERVQSDQAVGK